LPETPPPIFPDIIPDVEVSRSAQSLVGKLESQNMPEKSISAYNDGERANSYDVDMDLWHPNRHKMVDIALEVLPYRKQDQLTALDLGLGTGFFTRRFLERYPEASVIGIDGSEAMIQTAKKRLKAFSHRVEYIEASFANIENQIDDTQFDVVYSMYALHHLSIKSKRVLFSSVVSMLKVGGWFLNADGIISPFPEIERRIQEIRIKGIKDRNRGSDPRFSTSR
jgi:ubiquinone/menaquinone biosynthesis C-methylase UbiE